MLGRFKLYAIAAVVLIVTHIACYTVGWYFEWRDCQRRQEVETLKENDKRGKADDKIKRRAPDDVDKQRAISWLLDRARQ